MGQLNIIPPSDVLSLKGGSRLQGGTGHRGAKANTYRPGDTQPPLPLTRKRLELIKAYAENVLPNAEISSTSQIAQRFAPRAKPAPLTGDLKSALHTSLTASFSALGPRVRGLTVVLIAAAWLPNLALSAFWLRLIDPPSVTLPRAESHTPSVQSAIVTPVLSAPDMLEATEGEDVTFPIALDGTDGVPPGSVIVIRGLPPGSTLSNGHPQGETEWSLEPSQIGDLHLILPGAESGESKLTIQLLAPNNNILTDAATKLKIGADQTASIAAAVETGTAVPQVSDSLDQQPEAVVPESVPNADPGTSTSDLPPLPTRRPEPSAIDSGRANWISPSAYVNLRQSPSSSAPVVSVIAKGAKLRVMGRKRGWVQVTSPAIPQSGWIYSGNIETVRSSSRGRVRDQVPLDVENSRPFYAFPE